MSSVEYMKDQFMFKLTLLLENKGNNCQLFSRQRYDDLIAKVRVSKTKTSGKMPIDYQRLKRYDVVSIGGFDRLIYPVKEVNASIKYYVYNEELFQILHENHLAIGHGGRNKMVKRIGKVYQNITTEVIMLYLNLCEPCQNRLKVPDRGLVVKPMKPKYRIDLIDMQMQPDEDFKFIFVYEDYVNKIIQLRPLKTKQRQEVAHVLLQIFNTFGAPGVILYTYNGREYTNKLVEEACAKQSKSLKQCKGPEELDVENMLITWLNTSESKRWSEGLKFVESVKNNSLREAIKSSPSFHAPVKTEVDTVIPSVALTSVNTEVKDEPMTSD